MKTVVQEVASQVLGETSHKQRNWISDRTMQLSESARNARLNQSANYRTLRREATRSARANRQRYWFDVAENMEQASNTGDCSNLFRLIRKASGRRESTFELRDESGRLIPDLDGRESRWAEHFDQLLNRPSPDLPADLSLIESELYPINRDPPPKVK